MPEYTFETSDGKRTTGVYRMADAPRIGDTVTIAGEQCVRVPDSFQLDADIANVVHGYPYESNSLPRGLSGCAKSKRGKPIVQSRSHERELMARHNLRRD
jgi:hypothetical protein